MSIEVNKQIPNGARLNLYAEFIQRCYHPGGIASVHELLEEMRASIGVAIAYVTVAPNDRYEGIKPVHYSGVEPELIDLLSLDDHNRLTDVLRSGLPSIHTAEAAQEAICYCKLQGLRSEIVVPLKYEEQTFGVLVLGFREGWDFGNEDQKFFVAVGNMIAQVIENDRFQKMTEVVGKTIFSAKDITKIFSDLARSIGDVAGSEIVHVRMIDKAGGILNLEYSLNRLEDQFPSIDKIPRVPESISWSVIDETKKRLRLSRGELDVSDYGTFYIPDFDQIEDLFLFAALRKQYHLKGVLTVPIIGDLETLGVVNVYSKRPQAFHKRQQYLAMSLARSAGEALVSNRRLDFLNRLTKRINEVSSLSSSREVFETAQRDMISFFNFDYCTIFLVDHFERTIKEEYGNSVRTNHSKGRKTPYDKKKKDILNVVMWRNRSAYIRGDQFLERGEWMDEVPDYFRDIDMVEIDQEIVRYFYPIMAHEAGLDGNNLLYRPLGVVEVGYKLSTNDRISENLRADLALYIDNCAQPFYKNSTKELQSELEANIESAFDNRKSDENQFFEDILKYFSRKIGADGAEVSFPGFFGEKDWCPAKSIPYEVNSEIIQDIREGSIQKKGKIGIFRYVNNNSDQLEYYYTKGPIDQDEYYIPGLPNVHSQLSVLLRGRHNKEVIGVASFFSERECAFSEFHANWVRHSSIPVMRAFVLKRSIVAIDRLVNSFNVGTNISGIYDEVIREIGNYFGKVYAGVWEQVSMKKKTTYKCKRATDILEERMDEFGFSKYNIGDSASFSKDRLFPVRSLEDLEEQNVVFFDFANHYNFKSLILIPIEMEGDHIGYIDIYSERRVESISMEDYTFLKALAGKAAISIQNWKMTSRFLDVPLFFGQGNLEATLVNLVNTAQEVTKADPVVLFHFDHVSQRFNKLYPSGEFHDKKIVTMGQSDDLHQEQKLVRRIIDEKKDWWILSKSDFLKHKEGIIHSGVNFKEDFWDREKIASFAAIRLVKDDKVYGVMFFNFRTKKNFDEASLTRKMIDTFSRLASEILDTASMLIFNQEMIDRNFNVGKPAMVGEVSAGLAHNTGHIVFETMRNLEELQAVFNKIIEVDHEVKEEFNRKMEQIQKAIGDANVEYKRLKSFRRSGDEEIKELIFVNELVRDSFAFIAGKMDKKRIKVALELFDDQQRVQIRGNLSQLRHVLLNLYMNAWDAMDMGDRLRISAFEQGGNVVIRVHDSGKGIEDHLKGKIFLPYWTSKKDGTGLGLPISRHIIEHDHGGKMEFRSEKKKFTQFDVILKKHI